MPNTSLLGGFAAMTGVVSLEVVARAIRQKFSGEIADRNVLAAEDAYESVQHEVQGAHPCLAGAADRRRAPAPSRRPWRSAGPR